MRTDREKQADQYAWTHGDSQTRADFLAGWDAAVRDSVVSEEPEWEYGTEYDIDANESVFTATHSEEMARKWVAESPHDTGLVRRRKAGPWLPVEQKGPNDAEPR